MILPRSSTQVSDALLKLQRPRPGEVARAGYLADIGMPTNTLVRSDFETNAVPFALPKPLSHDPATQDKVIGPASTLKLLPKYSLSAETPHAVPKGRHWVDMTESGTVVVIDQPEGQKCAAIGGIMAQKMKLNGVAGCVVGGRVRDMAELVKSELPVSDGCPSQSIARSLQPRAVHTRSKSFCS